MIKTVDTPTFGQSQELPRRPEDDLTPEEQDLADFMRDNPPPPDKPNNPNTNGNKNPKKN